MPADNRSGHLIERLPKVSGRLEADVPLARFTWFKVGGPAEVLFRPADAEDLALFLAATPGDIPITIFGNASNLLVRDGGVAGVVIRLGSNFSAVTVECAVIEAGAGAAGLMVARRALDAGLTGLEFLSGIPGTVGGAVAMNAGAYGTEIGDVFDSAEVIDRSGCRRTLRLPDMAFAYRHAAIDPNAMVTSARLRARPGEADEIDRRMEEIRVARETSQPVRTPTGGSTFKNPTDHYAWELIDAARCRGLKRGGAMVSELHCNFLINTGDASAADLEGLGEEVRRRVREHSGVILEWEIRRIGFAAEPTMREVS